MIRRIRTSSSSSFEATSSQTAHSYRASGSGDERRYDRIEPSLDTVLARRGATRLSSEEFDELFGDLPTDDDE